MRVLLISGDKTMKLRFLHKQAESNDVASFAFAAVEPVSWIAGQSIRLELPIGYDTEERRFTISSAPYEQRIVVTTRLSESRFKQALDALEAGAVIDAYAIEGDFTWLESQRPRIFIAAGLGITPFIALLKQRDYTGQPLMVSLLYADRRQLIFGEQLHALAARHPEFHMSLLPDQHLSLAAILDHFPALHESLVYLAGPSSVVDELGAQLIAEGLPEEQLKRDWFTGRAGWD